MIFVQIAYSKELKVKFLINFDQNEINTSPNIHGFFKYKASPKFLPRKPTLALERKVVHLDINAVSHLQSNFNLVPLINENE